MKMNNMNSSGTLIVTLCGMVDGDKIRPSLQYGWSGWLVNIPIHTRFDLRRGTQIEVTPGNGLEKHRESTRCGSHE